jgi:kynurenine formamidase
MTHSGSHVDAPFHFLPELPSISELPSSHFYGPCIAVDLRPLQPAHGITSADLRKHEFLLTEGVFVLLKPAGATIAPIQNRSSPSGPT